MIFHVSEIPLAMRKIISLAQPTDPLSKKMLPAIDVAIPCHIKDFHNLHLVIQGAKKNIRNPINNIKLVTPGYLAAELKAKFPDCSVLTDESVLGPDIRAVINNFVPTERRSWISQQVIKFRVVIDSDTTATLILDADTIMLNPKVWLDHKNSQILCISDEYHLPYKNHQRRMWGGRNYPLSFVTHHQLMKREVLKEIFGRDGEGLISWIRLADYSEYSPISEYDTYGEWIVLHDPSRVVFSKWNNYREKINSKNIDYTQIKNQYFKYSSVSFHSYL
jgi:hypothetical protein